MIKVTLPHAFQVELDKLIERNNGKVYSPAKRPVRDASAATRVSRRNNLEIAFKDLRELGFALQTPFSLRQKHLHALGEFWQSEGLALQTMHTRFSALRVFGIWIRKPDLVGDIGDYCGGRAHLVRSTVCKNSRSWVSREVDPDTVIQKARTIDPRTAVALTLQKEFGLRVKESLEIRPLRVLNPDQGSITISDGTKGGRPRVIKIRTDSQRQALDEAMEISRKTRSARLRWPSLSWRRAQRRFYAHCAKLGITKAQLGVTPHGLRHGFAQDSYEKLSGKPSPVMGGNPRDIPVEVHRAAGQEVSEELGHCRIEVSASYYGSYGHQHRHSKLPATAQWV